MKLLRLTGSPWPEEARTAAYALARMIDRGEVELTPTVSGKCTKCNAPIHGGIYERGRGRRCRVCAG